MARIPTLLFSNLNDCESWELLPEMFRLESRLIPRRCTDHDGRDPIVLPGLPWLRAWRRSVHHDHKDVVPATSTKRFENFLFCVRFNLSNNDFSRRRPYFFVQIPWRLFLSFTYPSITLTHLGNREEVRTSEGDNEGWKSKTLSQSFRSSCQTSQKRSRNVSSQIFPHNHTETPSILEIGRTHDYTDYSIYLLLIIHKLT